MHGTPAQHAAGVHTGIIDGSTGGNLEGKEQRFGIANSALWTAVTTVTSCGAVNAAFESLTGIGGLVPMVDLGYGESVFGGVGTGLYTMLLYVLLAVFIGGLMVGRTPEFLGKKVEAREIKLVSLGVLVTPLAVLLGTGRGAGDQVRRAIDLRLRAAGLQRVALRLHVAGQQQRLGLRRLHRLLPAQRPGNIGAHGITFADLLGGVTMLGARFVPILLVLAVAGALAGKRVAPAGPGHAAHRHADLRRPARRHRRAHRRPDLLPRPPARPRRAGPDRPALLSMKLGKELITAAIAIVVLTVMLGVAYPLVMTGIAQVAFPEQGRRLAGRRSTARSSARSLIGKAFVIDTGKKDADGNADHAARPEVLPAAAVADRTTAPPATFFSNRGPNSAVGAVLLPRRARRLPGARAAATTRA